jgi:hypothetical protein
MNAKAEFDAVLIGQKLQTDTGGLIVPKVKGWYCPKCGGSYGENWFPYSNLDGQPKSILT